MYLLLPFVPYSLQNNDWKNLTWRGMKMTQGLQKRESVLQLFSSEEEVIVQPEHVQISLPLIQDEEMDTNAGFQVLGKERSSVKRRLRFTISKEMNFFDTISICFKIFFGSRSGYRWGKSEYFEKQNWKFPQEGISKIYS